MTGWMRAAPRWAVALVCVIAAVLVLVGGVAHLADLVRHGLRPYAWAPAWLNLYWTALTVLDPLAALLLLRGMRRGLDLACAILLTDLAANWYAVYGIQHSGLAAEPGLQRLTAFALLVLVAAPFLRKHLPYGGSGGLGGRRALGGRPGQEP
ncbi:hypothetical protein [Streptomyces sp. NPDC059452]|uniref:hypothetical protein n=1 Tax=Streptomyces sp. NPDC059452 TaxID=3346835 RepID=UPI0036B6AA82